MYQHYIVSVACGTVVSMHFPAAALPNGRPVVPAHLNSEVANRVLNPPGKS